MKSNTKPDFICIGPTKTGTTGLHYALNLLPEVEMPRAKELKYFWGKGDPRKQFNDVPIGKIEKHFGYLSYDWRKRYLRQVISNYMDGSDEFGFRSTIWDLKYLFLPQSLNWYKSLFSKSKISGDIDVEYVFFDEERISLLKSHLPDVKIIMILRDPIEKYWSDMRMWAYTIRKSDLSAISDQRLLRRFRQILNCRPRYCDIIDLWKTNFSDSQFYIAYFDELQNNPRAHLDGICAFLDIGSLNKEIEGLDEVIFPGVPLEIPAALELAGYEVLIPDIKRLVTLVESNYPRIWLKEMLERRAFLISRNE